ncbi:MAG: M50 family metallopeptidase, partial [Acidimicrobiales bacterium]
MTDTERRPEPPSGSRPAPNPPEYETGGLRLALLIGAVALAGLAFGWPVLVVILGIVVMIFLHELGHYLTAKWSGMKVTEFFIGFGPKIWSFQRGETEYGLKVLPAGAYVRIIGMNNLDEVDPTDEPRTYRQKSFPKRLLVVSAGSLMHFAQAFVLLVVLLGVVGFPGRSIANPPDRAPAWEINTVEDDSAAQAAGLQEDDLIVAVDGQPVSRYDELSDAIARYDVGDEVRFTIERDGVERSVGAELRPRPAGVPGGEAGSPFL